MLKGFAITPVVLGRISIGTIVENKGKKLPMKLDYIQITSNIQKDGAWMMHPVAEKLAKEQKDKIRSIPVRIMFDRPDLNFRAEYSAFNEKGRLLCSGNGEKARRRDPQSETGITECACPGSDLCEFGAQNRCKPFGRLLVCLEDSWDNDPLSGFMFRTTSFNSIRALTARLEYLAAASGKQMAGMPCNLVMRAKSTSASMRRPIYYLDLEPRGGLLKAMADAKAKRTEMQEGGFQREALEEAVRLGYEQSAFVDVDTDDDGQDVVAEFFNQEFIDPETGEVIRSGEAGSSGAFAGDQPRAGAQASSGQAANARTTENQTHDASGRPFEEMTDDELIGQVDEKLVESLKKSIARIPNLQDESSISGARIWNTTRFAPSAAAMYLIERHLNKQLSQIKGLPLEGSSAEEAQQAQTRKSA
ncbi:hypothetical protein [Thiobacillus denitrificans]|uniref:recombination directionality factor n=1 Tax=Thiobacillus denitrificans TaxID=36861 RepID=UPI00037048AA|nr:hypothetical protein [Thiobacillus denitrificans]